MQFGWWSWIEMAAGHKFTMTIKERNEKNRSGLRWRLHQSPHRIKFTYSKNRVFQSFFLSHITTDRTDRWTHEQLSQDSMQKKELSNLTIHPSKNPNWNAFVFSRVSLIFSRNAPQNSRCWFICYMFRLFGTVVVVVVVTRKETNKFSVDDRMLNYLNWTSFYNSVYVCFFLLFASFLFVCYLIRSK